MAILIRQATIHTQTALGVFRGDAEIRDGRIHALGRKLEVDEQRMEHIVDADGLHLCPGLVDAHIHFERACDQLETDLRAVTRSALASGVTAMALRQENGAPCLLRHGWDEAHAKGMTCVKAEALRDDALLAAMHQARVKGEYLACEIDGTAVLKRVLQAGAQTGCELLLVHLVDCCNMAEELVRAGYPVILGGCVRRGQGNVYELATTLQRAGLTVALTCDHPAASLHYLPMHAGLCMKAGLSEEEALSTVTQDAAKALGLGDQMGCIDVGRWADLTLFDGPPLRMTSTCIMTVLKGEIV